MPFGTTVCHLSTTRVAPRLQHSTLHRAIKHRAGNPQTMVYMNLQSPVGTAQRSPIGWWSLTPPSHHHRHRSNGCHSLLPKLTVTNNFYFRKWSALYCPDFPLALLEPATNRSSALTIVKLKAKLSILD